MRTSLSILLLLPLLQPLAGCQSAYFATMEQLGFAKREILVDRVEDGQQTQREAQEQVRTTYQRFVALTGYDGGDLQAAYQSLDREYRRCEAKSDEVKASIRGIESVAMAMFSEWRDEIATITDDDLRAKSKVLREQTQDRYDVLLAKMHTSASKMDPVLATFRDHVLFLKHNLNAQAIQSLEGTAITIEGQVEALIAEMQASIDEADAFISSMGVS
ncbi:DUF2959 family protein [Engelhardtia mirabilis]|uniref:DUF2959 domain-containing protein n=1 Tax=Engelhardtia mirabilis TaxID=2528011 RepID=A0A518BMV2_9BACT|nr:hypothetical protein Pla133_34070 [Planctomycetes bacterium Pla133]QDV02637.1 hypothetical protein Pla86_34060 [Planctomycetes bacterium Pla86]